MTTAATDRQVRSLSDLREAAQEAAYFAARHYRSRAHQRDLDRATRHLAECCSRARTLGCSDGQRADAMRLGREAGLVEAGGFGSSSVTA